MLKNFNKFDLRLLFTCAVLLLLFSYLLYDDSLIMGLTAPRGALVGNISLATDDVRLKLAADFRYVNVHGGEIHMGDSVFTGAHSKAKIRLPDNSVIELSENSMVTFSKVGRQLILNLKSGQISGESPLVQVVRADSVAATTENSKSRKPTSIEIPRPVITLPANNEERKITWSADGSTDQSQHLDLAWEYPKPTTEYEVQIASDTDFKMIDYSEITSKKKLTTPELKDGRHYLRVRENLAVNPSAPWSKVVSVVFVIEKPNLLAAAGIPHVKDNKKKFIIGAPEPAVIEWDPVPGAVQYMVEIDPNSSFKTPMKFTTPETRLTLKNLEPGTFSYRVTAMLADNEMTPPSQPGNADAIVLPPIPHPTLPFEYIASDDKDQGPPHSFKISWSPTPKTAGYIVEYDSDESFANAQQFETTGPSHMLRVPKAGKYFWHVKALVADHKDLTPFSHTAQVNYILKAALTTPPLLKPMDELTLFFQSAKENPFWLSWQSVENAHDYVLQLATDQDFNKVIVDKKMSATKYLISEKLPQGNIYWRVRAEAEGRKSGWSQARHLSVFAGRSAQGK